MVLATVLFIQGTGQEARSDLSSVAGFLIYTSLYACTIPSLLERSEKSSRHSYSAEQRINLAHKLNPAG